MKTRIFTSITFVILILSLFISCSEQKKEQQLTVLSWNVWHAGHSKTYGQKACDGIIGILKKSQADVILMVETYGAAPMIADSLGYEHYLISSNLCIFSRYPIVKRYSYPDVIDTFNFGGVEIDMDGTPVRLFDTWIHYLPDMRLTLTDKSEEEILAWDDAGTRDDEIRKILGALKPMIAETDSIPIIMGGDFNSHSHLDWTEATKDMYNHGGAVVNWTVSKEMEAANFKDSFREINPDPVKNIGTTWLTDADSLETVNRQDRIDFIYYQGKTIQAVESQCYDNILGETFSFKGDDFFYASDHGFVLTTFNIKK
ncbi:endonuclease/exonuclease/phosphatase family protein [Parabacteroides faecis]|uniref:endonuclease/exonuclease/phosphatase family protein n=1 Tax=Parabacteroides TaxID=375288 RepID=UPI000EFEC745|nr:MULTISPECIES: endonuclease/exonuclease/phosphatase family protein [Parabacteroides]MBC8617072.1 endonuclease/exonuclease/phosphatase family protein [Parabacteroides faecis]RHR97955.1 endonuclease/exonuclease/phosphatase family protein [Parabacteroides sp. AF14-59]